ncbi:5975_t:CDS:2, partial [Rhizophagus irregularis]
DNRFKNDYFAMGTSVELGWLIDAKNSMICTYKKNNNEIIRNNCKWEDLDGGDTLPGFTLNISIIEKIVSRDCDEIEDKCPYCGSHFAQVFAMLKHIAS